MQIFIQSHYIVSKYFRNRILNTSTGLMSRTWYPEVLPHTATGLFVCLFVFPKQLGQLKTPCSLAPPLHKNLVFHNCPQVFCTFHFHCFKSQTREVPLNCFYQQIQAAPDAGSGSQAAIRTQKELGANGSDVFLAGLRYTSVFYSFSH